MGQLFSKSHGIVDGSRRKMRGMETILCNVVGKLRRAVVDGRQYIVVPMTTIVPGVLNGSKGALYYPPEQIKASVKAWDGMPLTVYHPMGPMGEHASASDPGVLEKQGIGHIRNSTWKGKLVHEGWFDVERTRAVHPGVLDSLQSGRQIELSTGLYTDNVQAHNGANYNGKGYEYEARNYRPDHVAILPDQIGACSIRDGCGVLVNANSRDPHSGQFTVPGAGHGKGDVHAGAKAGFTSANGDDDSDDEIDPMIGEPAVTSKGGKGTHNMANKFCGECGGKMSGGKCVGCGLADNSNPEGHNQYSGGGGGSYGDRQAAFAGSKAGEDSTGDKATDATSSAKFASLKAQRSGTAAAHGKAAEAHDDAANAHRAALTEAKASGDAGAVGYHKAQIAKHDRAAESHNDAHVTAGGINNANSLTGNKEFSSDSERKAAFATMDDSGSEASGKAVTASRSAAQKKTSSSHEEAASAHKEAASAHKAAGNKAVAKQHMTAAHEHGAMASAARIAGNEATMTKEQKVAALIGNCRCTPGDRAALNGLSDVAMNALFKKKKRDDDDDDDDDDDETMNDGAMHSFDQAGGAKGGVQQAGGAGTSSEYNKNADAEWLRTAPAGVREDVMWARQQRQQVKNRLVEQLTANMVEGRKTMAVKFFQGKSLGELQFLVESLPRPQVQNYEVPSIYLSGGADQGQVVNSQEDVLPLPRMDFSKTG